MRRVRDFFRETWVSSRNPGLARNARPYMYIGTYCQYVEEKGCCSCKKQREPKRLALTPFLRVVSPPLVLLDLAGARSCKVLQ